MHTIIGVFVLYVLSTPCALAQNQSMNVLSNEQDILNISAHTYLLYQNGKAHSLEDIASYYTNKKLSLNPENYIPTGTNQNDFWLVFPLKNRSTLQRWYLSFGSLSQGRGAFIQDLQVYNLSEQTVIFQTSEQTPYQNQIISIPLKPNSDHIIAAHIRTSNGLLTGVIPQIIHEDNIVNGNAPTDYITNTLILLLSGLLLFCLSFSYIKNRNDMLYGSGFYACHILLLYFQSISSESGLPNATILPIILAFTSFGFAGYFNIALLQPRAGNLLARSVTSAIYMLCGATLLARLFVLDGSMLGDVAIFGAIFLSLCGLILVALSELEGENTKAPYIAGAWGALIPGLIFTSLSHFNLIPIMGTSALAFWIGFIPHGILITLALKKVIALDEEEQRYARLRDAQKAQSRARLKYSKESADQARLLRIIEQERELMTELRERERERSEEMRIAKDAADEANRAKSAFLAVVSHEVRTPMNGILGMVRLLSETRLNKEQTDYTLAIQKSGDTMMTLLNDILDFEKIEQGQMNLEMLDFDLIKMIQGTVTLMSGAAADKNVTLKSQIPDNFPRFLIGDPTRLRQILLNLINNALKFTQEGTVTVELRATRNEAECAKNPDSDPVYDIYFAVEDTGIGIAPEAQQRLFTPFIQADSSIARKYGGTGLGLAICRRLVNAMNGEINVRSELNVGSTFFFTIPMQLGHEEAVKSDSLGSRRARQKVRPMTILVVEDNEINRKIMQGFLDKDNHRVALAKSAEEAIDLFNQHNFDTVLSDINLSGDMSGIDLAVAIRAHTQPQKAMTTLIALTGNVSEDDIAAYFQAGFNDFLGKPIDPDLLAELLLSAERGTLRNMKATPKPDSSFLYGKEKTAEAQAETQPTEPSIQFQEEQDFTAPPASSLESPPSIEEPEITTPKQETSPPIKPAHTNTQFSGQTELSPIQQHILGQTQTPTAAPSEEITPLPEQMEPIEPTLSTAPEESIPIDPEPPKNAQQVTLSPDNVDTSALSFDDEYDPNQQSAPRPVLAETTPQTSGIAINPDLLKNLLETLGKEQLASLMTGFENKALEIISDLEAIAQSQHSEEIREKAHELKGMAANFGITSLETISEKIENLGQKGELSGVPALIKELPAAFERAKQDVQKFMDDA